MINWIKKIFNFKKTDVRVIENVVEQSLPIINTPIELPTPKNKRGRKKKDTWNIAPPSSAGVKSVPTNKNTPIKKPKKSK